MFGRSLFSLNRAQAWLELANNPSTGSAQTKFLPDFYKFGNSTDRIQGLTEFVAPDPVIEAVKNKDTLNAARDDKLTSKRIYEMKMLNDKAFTLNTNPEYIEQQLSDFTDKLGLIKSEEYDMRRGIEEVSSIMLRLENRKKYPDVKDFFEEFPYTMMSKIAELLKAHNYLELGQIAQFLADMPKEATSVMKEYNKNTDKICGKQAIFYIIADRKDFKKTNIRRDPILLAQSPFGHFWQILGAWDKEMLLIEEL